MGQSLVPTAGSGSWSYGPNCGGPMYGMSAPLSRSHHGSFVFTMFLIRVVHHSLVH
jgi:hypothetical protein